MGRRALGRFAAAPRGAREFSVRIKQVALGRPQANLLEVRLRTDQGVFESTVRDADLDFARAQKAVEETIDRSLQGLDPTDQAGIDDLLIRLGGPADQTDFGRALLSGVSMALARAGASAMEQSLVNYLASLSERSEMRLPLPIYETFDCNLSVLFFTNSFNRSLECHKELHAYLATQNVALETGPESRLVG